MTPRRRLRTLKLLLALLAIGVAVYSPVVAARALPDQTWTGGLWDGDDDDHVLLLVWDQSSVVLDVVSVPFASAIEPAPSTSSPRARSQRVVAADSRAPPLVGS